MKKTVLEKIANLKGMIDRRENPLIVKEQVDAIFEMINQEQDEQIKNKALDAMLSLVMDMVTEIDESPLTKLMDVLKKIEKKEKKVTPVQVNVHEYLDAIVIETNVKLPYSKMMDVIKKVVPEFEGRITELFSAELDKSEKQITMDYMHDKYKSVILDVNKWNLSDECLEIYTEGLVEYIQK